MLNRPAGLTQGYACLVQMDKPPGTGTAIITGTNIARQRNMAVEAMLRVPAFKWLLFADDDQTYPPDALTRLLAARQPIISAVITGKYPPYDPWVFAEERTPDGQKTIRRMAGGELAGGGILKVGSVGTGFVLIRRKVFEAMQPPWFEFAVIGGNEGTGEDVTFMLKAQNAGFGVFVDRSLKIGHLTVVSARLKDDGTSELTHDRYMRQEYVK